MADQVWFFTQPEDPVLKRRGDPLGFRQATDNFANLLAPGLSNRTVDARWLTILCWILRNANELWQYYRSGGDTSCPGDFREAAADLYTWIRPLELLWIARARELVPDHNLTGYQLPGIRAIERWFDGTDPEHFGLSRDQLRRYRQTGVYGAYRVALRCLNGLTALGDGWTIGTHGRKLATIVDKSLNWKPFLSKLDSHKGRKPNKEKHCRTQFWWQWERPGKKRFLPESAQCVRRLPKAERMILEEVIFDDGTLDVEADAKRRLQVVKIIKDARGTSHAALCRALEKGLPQQLRNQIAGLQPFSILADAGVDAMNAVWERLGGESRLSVVACVQDSIVKKKLGRLRMATVRWRKASPADTRAGLENVDRLADAVCKTSRSLPGILRALLSHHVNNGGGLRWFRMSPDEKTILRVARDRPYGGAFYRFRLAALARIAVQCGLLAGSRYKALRPVFGYELDED